MKTTGYDLRDALKQHELLRDTAAAAFNGSLKAFAGEKKESPEEIVAAFLKAEDAISRLQTAQMRYNLLVTVKVGDETMPLALAIKLVGGAARAEKMWKTAVGPKVERGYYGADDVRDPNQLRAEPTVESAQAMKLASAAAKRSSALRRAISGGNAIEVEIEDLDASLFE